MSDTTGHDTTAITVQDAADRLGITTGAVRKRIERGQLIAVKQRGQWLVTLDSLTEDATAADPSPTRQRDTTKTTRQRDTTRPEPTPDALVIELRRQIERAEQIAEQERQQREADAEQHRAILDAERARIEQERAAGELRVQQERQRADEQIEHERSRRETADAKAADAREQLNYWRGVADARESQIRFLQERIDQTAEVIEHPDQAIVPVNHAQDAHTSPPAARSASITPEPTHSTSTPENTHTRSMIASLWDRLRTRR